MPTKPTFQENVDTYGELLETALMARDDAKRAKAVIETEAAFRKALDEAPESVIQDEEDATFPLSQTVRKRAEDAQAASGTTSEQLNDLRNSIEKILDALDTDWLPEDLFPGEALEAAKKHIAAHKDATGATRTIRGNGVDDRKLPYCLEVDGPDFRATSRRLGQGGDLQNIRFRMRKHAESRNSRLSGTELDKLTNWIKTFNSSTSDSLDIFADNGEKYTILYGPGVQGK